MAINPNKLAEFIGKNNRLSRAALRTQDGMFVADAVDTDATEAKHFVGRAGFTKVVDGTGMHSLWASRDGRAFFMSGHELHAFDAKAGTAESLSWYAYSSNAVCYADLPDGSVALSDGLTVARIGADGVVRSGMLAAPSPEPTVVTSPGDGQYLYCFAYADSDGVLGMCSTPRTALSADLAFDVPQPPAGLTLQIYASYAGGEVMYLAAETTDAALINLTESRIGGECPTLHMQPVPGGSILGVANGRLFSVVGNLVFFSNPFHYGAMEPLNFIALPDKITVFAPYEDGFFVVADKTYWLQGRDPFQAELKVVSDDTAVARSQSFLTDARPVWLASNGIVVGDDGGTVKELTEEVVQAHPVLPTDVGATVAVERPYARQIISNHQRVGFARAGFTMTAE